jgi:hypothetical protein
LRDSETSCEVSAGHEGQIKPLYLQTHRMFTDAAQSLVPGRVASVFLRGVVSLPGENLKFSQVLNLRFCASLRTGNYFRLDLHESHAFIAFCEV